MSKITSTEELETVVMRASADLQAIQDYAGSARNPSARVRFPRGFLRTAASIRDTLPTLNDDALVRNIS